MSRFTPRQVMLPAVVCFTIAHLGLRWSASLDDAMHVSPLQPGEAIVADVLPAEAQALAPSACLQVVVFAPECPFCQHAADRERETVSPATRAARLWYTDSETALLSYFVAEHLGQPAHISPELVKALRVEAVPALFVLAPTGQIRWVGGYQGDESDEELAARCTEGSDQDPTT